MKRLKRQLSMIAILGLVLCSCGGCGNSAKMTTRNDDNSSGEESTTSPTTTNDNNNSKNNNGYEECHGKLVFQNEHGKFESYCYKEKDLINVSDLAVELIENRKKCGDPDNIFYEIKGDGKVESYCNLGESVPSSDVKLNEKQQEMVKVQKTIRKCYSDFFFYGSFGSNRIQRSVIRNYRNGTVKLENFLTEFKKAEDKDIKEQNAVAAVRKSFKFLVNESWVKIEEMGKKFDRNEISVESFQAELEKARERAEEIKRVVSDYYSSKYGSGRKVGDVMERFLSKEEESAKDLQEKLEAAQKEDEKTTDYKQKIVNKCQGELVFREKNGEFESYCYKKEHLMNLQDIHAIIMDFGVGKKCCNSDNIFFDFENKIYCDCNLEKPVPGSGAELSKEQQDVMRKKKVIFDEFYSGKYGHSSKVFNIMEVGWGDTHPEEILERLKKVKAEEKALEKCKTQDEAFRKYWEKADKFKHSLELGNHSKKWTAENEEKRKYLIGYSCHPEVLIRMELGVFATHLTKKEKEENEMKYKEWLDEEQLDESELVKLYKDKTNCHEYRKVEVEKVKASVDAKKIKLKNNLKRHITFSTIIESPRTIFDKFMSLNGYETLGYYYEVFMPDDLELFMEKDLDVVLENKKKLALVRKIIEEYYYAYAK